MTTPLQIPNPCSAPWEAMAPSAMGRHCAACATTVVDLTAVAPGEEVRLRASLAAQIDAGARICVHARTTSDGLLVPARRRRRLLSNGLAAVMAMAVAGCSGSGPTMTPAANPQAPGPSAPPAQPLDPAAVPAPTGAPAPVDRAAVPASAPVSAVPVAQMRTTGMLVRPTAVASPPTTAAPVEAPPAPSTPPQPPQPAAAP